MRYGNVGNSPVYCFDSPVMAVDEQIAQEYDSTLEPMEKKYLPSQDEFYIMSHSFVEEDGK